MLLFVFMWFYEGYSHGVKDFEGVVTTI